MYHLSYDTSYGWQSQWDSLGGVFTSEPAVASWSSDRLDVFGTGTDYAMYHKAWDGSSWSSDWEVLGGTFTSPPAVVSWGVGRLDIFGLGTDFAVWHLSYDSSTGWQQGWDSLGGGPFKTPPVVVSRASDRLDVFAVASGDNAIWHKSWSGSSWSDWASIGKPVGEVSSSSSSRTSSARTTGLPRPTTVAPTTVTIVQSQGDPTSSAASVTSDTTGGPVTVTVQQTPAATSNVASQKTYQDMVFLMAVLHIAMPLLWGCLGTT